MAEPVIITTGGDAPPDAGATFAAGVAAATAAQAAQEAQEATAVAEGAESAASAALAAASDAEYTAAMAREDIRGLESKVMLALDTITETLAAAVESAPAVDNGAPEVIVTGSGDVDVSASEDQGDGAEKPKRKARQKGGFGWDGWFGER